MLLIIFLVSVIISGAYHQEMSVATDLKALTELPLEKLLQVKNSLEYKISEVPNDIGEVSMEKQSDDINFPEALPLTLRKKPYNRGGYEEEYHYKKDNDKKDLSSVFQLTVTTLSFLAFGGYLLCLIVHAIRSKKEQQTTTTTTMATLILKRKRKPQKLSKPAGRPGSYRPRPNNRYKRETNMPFTSENMYDALVVFAERFAHYQTMDYNFYNSTIGSTDSYNIFHPSIQ